MTIKKEYIFAVILIVLTAANLRAPITCVGSLVNIIREDFGIAPETAGFITTIPLLAFAAVSPVVVSAAEMFGAGKVLVSSFIILCCGIVIRSYTGAVGIFAGTMVIGVAIAIGNVLLPAVIKSKFPDRIESMTSMYTVIMQVVSTVSTAISVPVAAVLGWRGALAVWFVPAALAMVLCLPNRKLQITHKIKDNVKWQKENAAMTEGNCSDANFRKPEGGSFTDTHHGKPEGGSFTRKNTSLYKKAMTWWVTFYMGVQSLLFYSFIAWLSPFMQDSGYSEEVSGYFLSIYVVMGMVGSAALPVIMKWNGTRADVVRGTKPGGYHIDEGQKTKNCGAQSATGILLGVLYLTGIVSMMFTGCRWAVFAGIVICGFCSGTCISFSMALMGIHTSNGKDASRLSGHAQSVGYLLAATGPVAMGKIYGMTGGWMMPMIMLALCAVFLIGAGKIVGRDEIL